MKLGCSYFGNRILKHAKVDMQELVDMGCTYVVHTFNENDMVFYHKNIGEMVALSHELGLEVHIDPWGVGKVFGGESFSNFVMQNPDAVQMVSDGKPAGMACPNHPKFRAFMREWTDAAVETGGRCSLLGRTALLSVQLAGRTARHLGLLLRSLPDEVRGEILETFPGPHDARAERVQGAVHPGVPDGACRYGQAEGPEELPVRAAQSDAAHGTANLAAVCGDPGPGHLRNRPVLVRVQDGPPGVRGRQRARSMALCDERGTDAQIWLQWFKVHRAGASRRWWTPP